MFSRLRVSPSVHFSSSVQHVPAGKKPPEDTRLGHKKTSPAAQRTGHRRVATRKTTGGYPATQGTDPGTELRRQWCCATATSGLHRLWWTLVYARIGNRLHSAHPWVNSTRRLLDDLFPLPTRNRARRSQSDVDEVLEFLTVITHD